MKVELDEKHANDDNCPDANVSKELLSVKQSFMTVHNKSSINSNMTKLLEDDSIFDVIFAVNVNGITKEYRCIKVFFAAQSSVFKLSL